MTLVLWHQEQPPYRVQIFQQIIDKFNASHPNITVKQEVQDFNQVYQKLAAAVQTKTQPNLLQPP